MFRTRAALHIAIAAVAIAGCETTAVQPDFSGRVTFDLGPPIDLPAPYGFDANMLAIPPSTGTLVFSITDVGGLVPARVIFRPPPGSGFADSLTVPPAMPGPLPGGGTGATVSAGVVGAPEGVMLQSGWGQVQVPPGHYQLFITRGPEYEAVKVEVDLVEGQTQAVNAELVRSVDTRGWLAADMHIHSGKSFDSKVPSDRRAISMVTNGIEILVPTEHHGSYDYKELLVDLGYGIDRAGSIAGAEMNFREGHAGVYPLVSAPLQPRGGVPPYQDLNPQGQCDKPVIGTNCLTAADAFPLMRTLRDKGSVVTVNHPWWGTADLGYFTNIGWGAGTGGPFPTPLATAVTFDAIEIINGYWTHPDAEAFLIADWFYLLGSGFRIAALGNSDTHRLDYVRAGWPRTWLRLPIENPGEITEDLLYDAIRHQRAIASTGPFVTLEIGDGQIGDTVRPTHAGFVPLHIVADAPTWMSLDEVIVFMNGRELHRYAVPEGTRPRFEKRVTEEISQDAYFVVLAVGKKPMPGDVVGEQGKANGRETLPWAITNPIYVDANGDGEVSLQPPTMGTLPWKAPPPNNPMETTFGPHSIGPHSLGSGSSRPAGPECDPRERGIEHPPLDAQSQLYQQALPLLDAR